MGEESFELAAPLGGIGDQEEQATTRFVRASYGLAR